MVIDTRFREIVRAYAFGRRETLSEPERAGWRQRYEDLGREAHVTVTIPAAGIEAFVWRSTLRSLSELKQLRNTPRWFTDRHAEEERRLLAAYEEAHLDLLCAALGWGDG